MKYSRGANKIWNATNFVSPGKSYDRGTQATARNLASVEMTIMSLLTFHFHEFQKIVQLMNLLKGTMKLGAELYQIPKDDVVKLHHMTANLETLSSITGMQKVNFHLIPKEKIKLKNVQTTTNCTSSHITGKVGCSLQSRLNSMWTEKFQMSKLDEKEEPGDQIHKYPRL